MQQVYREGETISAIPNTVIDDAEKLGLEPIYKANSGEESIIDQELDICNRVYETATYDMRRVFVTIKKHSVNKPSHYLQILRLFNANEIEEMKQVAYVIYTLNEFKELSQTLGDFMFVDKFKKD